MFRWQRLVGAGLGLLTGLSIVSLSITSGKARPPTGPILSECDGRICELVIQYEPSAKELALPVYRSFLEGLDAGIVVYAVCPSRSAFDELSSFLGPLRCRLSPLLVTHPMTTWSRDRWVALGPVRDGAPTTLWSPRGEAADEIWPARAGDEHIGEDIAASLPSFIAAQRSPLFFDGGDLLADREGVFVVGRVLQRNIQHTVWSREEFLGVLGNALHRRIVLLENCPDHHAAMFMASAGNKTVLVGDPSLARQFLPLDLAEGSHGDPQDSNNSSFHPDFTPQTQRLFDAVAAQCSMLGYKVIRIPVVPGCDGRTYLTYSNVIIDSRGNHRIVYLPTYRGVERLNAAARSVWQELGYEVHSVDCSSAFRHFGCLHCLVNVLRRS